MWTRIALGQSFMPVARLLVQLVAVAGVLRGAVDVTVGRYQAAGTGANLAETILNTGNVNPVHFGKLFSYEVEGAVYAQPLIVSGISIADRTRSVLYIATMSNVLYALDADDAGPAGGLLWSVRFSENGALPLPAAPQLPFDPATKPYGHKTVQGSYGIESTPVIDRSRNTIYLIVRTVESSGHVQRLHALDLVSGRERPGSPVEIKGINPQFQMNRAGLALAQSKILAGYTMTSKLDEANYRGLVIAFDADTLSQTGSFCTSCVGASVGAGIWQTGRPPAVDRSGNVYYFAGNGWPTGRNDQTHRPPCIANGPDILQKPAGYYGESLIKLDPSNGLRLIGSWTPTNWCDLDNADNDLGGSGPALINVAIDGTQRTIAVGGGKAGALYAVDTGLITKPDLVAGCAGDQPAGLPAGIPPCPVVNRGAIPGTPFRQGFCVSPGCPAEHHIMAGPVYWPRLGLFSGGSLLFVSVENDVVRAFPVANAVTGNQAIINPVAASKTTVSFPGHPGAILSLSADGEKTGSGILWAAFASGNTGDFVADATFSTRRGQLAAFDAANLSRTLWTSDMQPGRDALGYFAKFNPPTVANGKVYVAAFPPPESYASTVDCEKWDDHNACIQFVDQTYTAPGSMGRIVVYGLNPPAEANVRSFSSEMLPAVLSLYRR
jgi:hypothetical protein